MSKVYQTEIYKKLSQNIKVYVDAYTYMPFNVYMHVCLVEYN